ncbi:hypothetical protein [Methanosarcina barkeri]|nr:hypothetical protein [Methanosarcina barkeri]
MWKPVYIFLYECGLLCKKNIYRKILSMDISVVSGSQRRVKLTDSCISPNRSELQAWGSKVFRIDANCGLVAGNIWNLN